MQKANITQCIRGIAVILLLSVLLSACGGGVPAETVEKNTSVRDPEAAITDLEVRAENLGYADAMKEMTLASTHVSGELTFYRLQQNYGGIPVDGRQVVYVTDGDGICKSITHNLRQLMNMPDLTPTVSAEMVEGFVYSYIVRELRLQESQTPLNIDLHNAQLCIYDSSPRSRYEIYDGDYRLAYRVDWDSYLFIVDAHTGEVLQCRKQLHNATAPAALANGEEFHALSLSEGLFVLMDMEENVYLFDAGGKAYNNHLTGNLNHGILTPVTSPDNVFGDGNDTASDPQTAAAVFAAVRNIRKFFRDTLGDQSVKELLVVYNDSFGGAAEQAAGGMIPASAYTNLIPGMDPATQELGVVVLGAGHSAENLSMDVLAHEYTHALTQQILAWDDRKDETKMVREAFSDVLGELAAASVTGQDPDWVVRERNIRDRESSGQAQDTNGSGNTIHNRSMELSHAAYRMWNGMDGMESMKIPTDQLAQLWYRALLMLPADADFVDCRSMVAKAGQLMGLSPEQQLCIQQAFNLVNVQYLEQRISAFVDREFTFEVYCKLSDGTWTTSTNEYTLTVTDADGFYGTHFPLKEGTSLEVKDGLPLSMTLDYGLYRFAVEFSAEEATDQTILVLVAPGGAAEAHIPLQTEGSLNFKCQVETWVHEDGHALQRPLANAKISLYRAETGELVAEYNSGADGAAIEDHVPWGNYRLCAEAEGFQTYEKNIRVFPGPGEDIRFDMKKLETDIPPTESEPPHFSYPQIVSYEADMDYGVYPFPDDFIEGGASFAWDKDTYGYDQTEDGDIITTENPYFWWLAIFSLNDMERVEQYLAMLEQAPFCLELVYTKDMGNEWVYLYRYTGKHKVYPLNISGFVPEDGGEYHLAIDVAKSSEFGGCLTVEVAAGYGLESVNPETLEDILCEIGYNRYSNASENIDNTAKQSGICYFCHKTVYATPERPIYDEQIVYCDACYADMFDEN